MDQIHARRNRRRRLVYLAAALLMILRVDFWWWGEPMPPVVLGWLNAPMLYQLGIWLAGYSLVLYTANAIWTDEESR